MDLGFRAVLSARLRLPRAPDVDHDFRDELALVRVLLRLPVQGRAAGKVQDGVDCEVAGSLPRTKTPINVDRRVLVRQVGYSDVDRAYSVVSVRRTVSGGEVVELAKTAASRRQVPLAGRAVEALDQRPPRLDTPLLFPSSHFLLNLNNLRRRDWTPAVEATAIRRPARIYDLHSTFASDALAAGVSAFELARVMGTSIRMIERHYGALLDALAPGSPSAWTLSTPPAEGVWATIGPQTRRVDRAVSPRPAC